jgi:dinuclear metal center YbgI/SA1388 family protein
MQIYVKDIAQAIDQLAPSVYQESYDNVGLLVGNPHEVATGIMVSLDCLDQILDEAIANNCNVIVCHHPIIFKGLKKLTGANYIERVVIKAIQHKIAIIACHTNLDNMLHGVNEKIAAKLGLIDCRILAPTTNLIRKFQTYVPQASAEMVRQGLFEAGAGKIGLYDQCSFTLEGSGTFRPLTGSNPMVGKAGGTRETTDEVKIEMIYEKHLEQQILQKFASFTYYEEKAYEIFETQNLHHGIGSGRIGQLKKPLSINDFLQFVKTTFGANGIRYTSTNKTEISTVAVCGGSGSFLLPIAKRAKADAYISADFKYHEFFDAENEIMITDIGHFESEQFTSEIFIDYLREKFPNFAIHLAQNNTNPIHYF